MSTYDNNSQSPSLELTLQWAEQLRLQAKKNKDFYTLELSKANALIVRQQILLNRYEANLKLGELTQRYNSIAQSIDYLEQTASHLVQNIQQIVASSRFKVGVKIVTLIKEKVLRQRKPYQPWAPDDANAILNKINHWKDLFRKRKAPSTNLESKTYSAEELQQILTETQQAVIERIQDCDFLCELIDRLENNLAAILNSAKYRLGNFIVNDLIKRFTFDPKRNAPWAPEEARQLLSRFRLWKELQREACFSPVPFEQYLAAKAIGSIPPGLIRKTIPSKHIRVTQFTPSRSRNPYYNMIPDRLITLGWNFDFDTSIESIINKIDKQRFDSEIVHFHQLEPYYHSPTGDIKETKRKAEALLENIANLKNSGAKIVWTQHNPLPHDRTFAEVDKFLLENFSLIADHVLVLGNKAKSYMADYITPKRIAVIEHPSFRGYYGEAVLKEVARSNLGISADTFIFGSPGEIKPYKDYENIISATNDLVTKMPNHKIKLLLAGPAKSKEYVQSLKELGKDNVIIIDRILEDHEIPETLGALDAAVFSFKDIFASSGVVLALSYNLPTIVPRLGCLDEYVIDNNNGLLYEHNNAADMVEKMMLLIGSDLRSHFHYMCNEFNREYSVENIAARFEEMYIAIANQ